MAQQIVNIGAAANDHTGDNLRAGATKINANFTELYNFNATLGSAALASTGTTGGTIPFLNGANTWGALNIFSGSLQVPNGQYLKGVRNLGSVAVNMIGFVSGTDRVDILNGGGGTRFSDNTAVTLMTITTGVVVGNPTGGDKGVGTVNATALYDDNTLLTCYVLEAYRTGKIDVEAWDGRVANRTIPGTEATVDRQPLIETVEVEGHELHPVEGGFELRPVAKTIERQVVDQMPVWDEKGNGVDAVDVPAFTETEIPATPERIEERSHSPARRFAESRMDELDPEAFAKKWKASGVLPGMPTPEEWASGSLPTGDMIQRLWELCELQAVHIETLRAQIAPAQDRK